MKRMYPVTVTIGGESMVLPTWGSVAKFVRVQYYPVYRAFHIRGWRKCDNWGDVLDRLAEREGFSVVWSDAEGGAK